MRDLTSGMSAGIAGGVVRPVLLGRLDIADDPIVAWTGTGIFAPTGTGDTALDGQTFNPATGFIEMSSIQEDQAMGGPVTITARGEDLDETLLRQVVRDKRAWRGRNAWLWFGLLNADLATVIDSPARIKTGVMTQMVVARQQGKPVVYVTIDEDLGQARGGPFRWLDHTRFWPADTFSTYVTKLANKPQGLDASDVRVTNPTASPQNYGNVPYFRY